MKIRKLPFLTGIVIAFIVLEIVLRVFYNPPEIDQKYQWDSSLWLLQNVQLNSVGYRDEEHTLVNRYDKYRMYVIGNSYSFGWFINKVEDTYPALIEQRLNRNNGNVEVINGSMWGYRIKQEYDRLILEGRKYRPDLIVLGLIHYEGNVSNTHFRPADVFLPEFIRKSRSYYYLIGQHLQRIADERNIEYYSSIYKDQNSVEWRNFESYIKRMSDAAKEIGSRFAIVVFPFINEKDPNSPYEFHHYNKRIEEVGKKYDIIIVDPLDKVLAYKDRSKLVLNPLDAHPTEELHKIVADEFIETVDIKSLRDQVSVIAPDTELLTQENQKIAPYIQILSVVSQKTQKSFLYHDAKDQAAQELPVPQFMHEGTFIYPNKFIVSPKQEPQLNFYTYSHDGYSIKIPNQLYGYKVVGVNQIHAYPITRYGLVKIDNYEVSKGNNHTVVKLKRPLRQVIFRLNLTIASDLLLMDSEQTAQMVSPNSIFLTTKNDTASITVPVGGAFFSMPHFVYENKLKTFAKEQLGILESITNTGLFSLTDKSGNLKPYAKKIIKSNDNNYRTYIFVNNKQVMVKHFSVKDDLITITLNEKIKKGTRIEVPLWVNYDFSRLGPVELTVERSNEKEE